MKRTLSKVFSVTNEKKQKHKIITILGIKIKLPRSVYRWKKLWYTFDSLFPKNDRKIVFLSFPDFSDNAKEFYEYMKMYHSNEYDLVWLYEKKQSSKFDYIQNKFFLHSFAGIWHLITSKYVVYTGLALSNVCNFKKHKLLQLWHGMPLKTLGYTEKNISKAVYKQYKKYGETAHFFVSSDIFKLSMIASFLVNPNRIFVTGQAKTDCILGNRNQEIITNLYGINDYEKLVIYAPTYKEAKRNKRRDIDTEFENIFYCQDYDEEKFFKVLEKNNILFIIKPHPFDEPFYRKFIRNGGLNHPNIKVLFDRDMKDNNLYFYDFFQFTNLLITDFSSIAIDYLISKKPVIFMNSVAEEYSKNRGFILEDNYEILMPGAKVNSFATLLDEMHDSLFVDSWKQKRESMLPLLYKHFDNNSSARIYEVMKGL